MVFDARTHLALQQRDEVIALDLTVTEDCGQEARTYDLTCMNRYNRSAAVGMTKEVMAALGSSDIESGPPQGSDCLPSRDSRKVTHATVIFWIPMKSSGSTLSPWTSRQSSTASCTLAINSSSEVACV